MPKRRASASRETRGRFRRSRMKHKTIQFRDMHVRLNDHISVILSQYNFISFVKYQRGR